MMGIGQIWSQLGSIMASIMFVYAMFEQFFPPHLRTYVRKYTQKFTGLMYPYIQIKFPEFSGERLKRSEAYSAIQTYLSANSSQSAKKLKAEVVKDSQTPLVLSMDDNEEINDEFQGEGKAIALKNRQLKLYTNNPSNHWHGYKSTKWSHITFDHPARFETLAMDPKKKEEIINDLVKFRNGKEYYAKIGKAWKRGYLLYGPPGTGKSTMIAAMANFMNYDVYDLELTAVKENTDLRKLLIETSSKSIIVIEDIDCSLDLTGQRKKKKEKDEDDGEVPKNPIKKDEEEENKGSKVTLSGLLNFIDGIWSACGGEKIIIFTTNFVEKLDPALIRRGRMDKHIELSYCCYEAFKVLANNYLDVESHSLFPTIEKLLGETNMTPADVAENLMPKSITEDSETCLKNLIDSLEKAKDEAKKKAEEEAKKKAEDEEAQLKPEKEKEQLGQEEEVKPNGKSKEEVKENGKSKEDVKANGKSEEEVKENGTIY
ncbi:AAA-ATPase ASD, mitochondrial-like isoform X3 [Gastrolobium bilobum]|uniref:AAA-ATPase ASD, mitochondrial-like isoform X3 n=1 Tax=Gastrolobium bilobum TaxID=150636 RepID=UPI002AB05E4B|nr:AAA-ATPase ASD, mitochondrial-like isoform X3 [Gastrolobium bilobum]XP_061353137.1 AAA-ATPase ASD, mitochondrial-like isoform X3 [Gastrolobium bilobum]